MDDKAEDWREIWSLERPERVYSAVVRELEAYGVRVPTKLVLERVAASVSQNMSVNYESLLVDVDCFFFTFSPNLVVKRVVLECHWTQTRKHCLISTEILVSSCQGEFVVPFKQQRIILDISDLNNY